MAKRKKNKALPLIIMAGVLVALIVGYALLSAYNAKKAEEEANTETSTVEVLKKASAIPVAFSYDIKNQVLEFSYDNEEWIYIKDNTFPVDNDTVTKMVSGLTDIKAVSVVNKDGADVADFGLESPALTLSVKYSDGTDYTFKFGIVNSYNGYQYMTYTGSDHIYMVESTLASTFTKELKSLYKAEIWTLQNDAVTAEDVTSITIESADGQTNTIEDENGIEALFELVYKLNLSKWEDHYANETEMKDTYGIYPECDRVTLNYTKETTISNEDGSTTKANMPASYTVYFGYEFEVVEDSETTADGEESSPQMSFFYTQKGSSVVYSKDKDVADDIFEYLSYSAPEATETIEDAE